MTQAPKTILVVDDDAELSDGIKIMLELVDRIRPDLVILDMMMPRMGGYPVLEHYKDRKDAPPFIMITANEGARHKAYAELLGVVDYIRKPFPMERLLEAVDRGLSQSPPQA